MNDLTLRSTHEADLYRIVGLETGPDTLRWLGETGESWHRNVLADRTQEHLSAVMGDDECIGFVVLAGLAQADGVVEIRRVVVGAQWRGKGHGQALLRAAVARACEVHGAKRVWLDVKPGNSRARRLYSHEGFEEEKLLTNAIAEPDGTWSDLIIMAKEVR